MKRKFRTALALILALAMCISQPTLIYATESGGVTDGTEDADSGDDAGISMASEEEISGISEEITASGTYGDNLTWELTSEGTLTIYGSGVMSDYSSASLVPWVDYKDLIISVLIDSNITTIGDYAFSDCQNLKEISLPDGLTEIGFQAFWRCISLENIEFPDSLITISSGAFQYCSSLTDIILPENLTVINGYVFYNCTNLETICIPSGVTKIDTLAFYECGNLSDVSIPESMTMIGDYAFTKCTSLYSINIPAKVAYVGESAFAECNNLEEINVDINNTHYSSQDGVLYDFAKNILIQYPAGKEDSTFTILDTVITIENYAFSGCQNLNSIEMLDNVTSIGDYAFYDCENIVSIHLSENILTIGANAFCNCLNLMTINLPSGITKLEKGIFSNCYNLTSVTIPDTVTSIGESAFEACHSLKSITIPSSVSQIGDYVFWPNTFDQYIEEIEIYFTGNAPYISSYCFYNAIITAYYPVNNDTWTTSVMKDYGGKSVTWVSYEPVLDDDEEIEAEGKCGDNLTWTYSGGKLTISGTGEMYDYAEGEAPWYSWIEDIMFVNIEDGVTSIGSYTFADFPLLLSITIPTSLKIVDDSAFPDSTNLSVVYYEGTSEEWDNIAIGDDNSSLLNAQIVCEGDDGEESKDPATFNASIYHANTLVNGIYEIDSYLDAETECSLFVDALKENGTADLITFWNILNTEMETLDDITTLSDIYVDEVDVYCALILDVLEATVNTDGWVSNQYPDAAKETKTMLSDISTILKNDYNINVNETSLCDLTIEEDEILKKVTDYWFKENYPDLDYINSLLKPISKAVDVTEDIEDYVEYCMTCYELLNTDNAIKEVLQNAYERSARIYGTTDPLTIAFERCKNMIADSTEELLNKMEGEAYIAIGYNAYKYIVGELLWDNVTDFLEINCPEIYILKTAYSAGKTITNSLCSTDDTAEQYIKMTSILRIEGIFSNTYKSLESTFKTEQSQSSAENYLSAMRLMFRLRNLDYETAYKYVDILEESPYGSFLETIGVSDYESCRASILNIQGIYSDIYQGAERAWVNYLEEDYPDSGLYEEYSPLLYLDYSLITTKRTCVWCPVDVYVYNTTGDIVAYAADGRVSCNTDDIMIALLGEEKVIDFYNDDDYTLKLVGYDTGTMDIVLYEYDEDGAEIRTVNYYDVELTDGKTYSLNINGENLQSYELNNVSDITTVPADFDSLSETQSYTLEVISGTTNHNDDISTKTTAKEGESIQITAYIPEDYEFICWTSSNDSAKIEDIYEISTTVIMPASDVTITATVKSTNTCGESLTWIIDEDGTLTISGTGDMEDYDAAAQIWSEYAETITSIVIEDGVTSIGDYAFYGLTSLESVTIPGSVAAIGDHAFEGNTSLTDIYYAGSESDWALITIGDSNDSLTAADIHYESSDEIGGDGGDTGDSGDSGESGETGDGSGTDEGSGSGTGTDTESGSEGSGTDTGSGSSDTSGTDSSSAAESTTDSTESTDTSVTTQSSDSGTDSSETTAESTGSVDTVESADTGDESMMFLLLTLVLISGTALLTLNMTQRKRRNHN